MTESGHWVKGNPIDPSGRIYNDKHEATEGIVGDAAVSVDGYMILEAENYEKAIELLRDCPTLVVGGHIEIRECLEM